MRVIKENTYEELDLITCTFEHPFYVLNADSDRSKVLFEGKDEDSLSGSWISSKDLRVGDKLLLSNGESGIISSIEVEHYDEPQTTYNFEVADFHTYYVGSEGILVHNFCPKEFADYSVKYKGPGGNVKAYHQSGGPYDGLFIAKDSFGHGGSSFKLLKEATGSKLRLIADLSDDGIIMAGKHSSNIGELYKFFGRRML